MFLVISMCSKLQIMPGVLSEGWSRHTSIHQKGYLSYSDISKSYSKLRLVCYCENRRKRTFCIRSVVFKTVLPILISNCINIKFNTSCQPCPFYIQFSQLLFSAMTLSYQSRLWNNNQSSENFSSHKHAESY